MAFFLAMGKYLFSLAMADRPFSLAIGNHLHVPTMPNQHAETFLWNLNSFENYEYVSLFLIILELGHTNNI